MAFFFLTWMMRRSSAKPKQERQSPDQMLGYHQIACERGHFQHPCFDLLEGEWRVLRPLEDIPQPERRRLVMTIGYGPTSMARAQIEPLLWNLATYLQRTARVHAVVVEAFANMAKAPSAGQGQWCLLYAVDGRGWSGEEQTLAMLKDQEGVTETFGLGDAHRAVQVTLDVAVGARYTRDGSET